ncbi:ATP-binding protein [Rhodococcus cerastii]|nr:ATP-binding protein [Rhodococcus cerastii]
MKTTGAGDPTELNNILTDHEYHGVLLQLAIRGVLVIFIASALIFVPPARYALICELIFALYALWAVAVTVWMWKGDQARIDSSWMALFVDLTVVTSLSLLTGTAGAESWTANILTNALFMIPLLACTQLRPWICAGVVVPTVAVFLISSALTKGSNSEPWVSILLSTVALAGLGAGAVVLSWIQRSRIQTIGALAQDRTSLLADLMSLEERERQTLAEQLHDGALQYVLAARQDLEDVKNGQPEALERMTPALWEASRLLRNTAAELHPAVLERTGLVPALSDAARAAGARGGFTCEINTESWPFSLRTSADSILFSAARELLTNVAKHAHASKVKVTLQWTGRSIYLEILDDGAGIAAGSRDKSLQAGHIGLASQELRLAAAGGRLSIKPGAISGTSACVEVPASPITNSMSSTGLSGS